MWLVFTLTGYYSYWPLQLATGRYSYWYLQPMVSTATVPYIYCPLQPPASPATGPYRILDSTVAGHYELQLLQLLATTTLPGCCYSQLLRTWDAYSTAILLHMGCWLESVVVRSRLVTPWDITGQCIRTVAMRFLSVNVQVQQPSSRSSRSSPAQQSQQPSPAVAAAQQSLLPAQQCSPAAAAPSLPYVFTTASASVDSRSPASCLEY